MVLRVGDLSRPDGFRLRVGNMSDIPGLDEAQRIYDEREPDWVDTEEEDDDDEDDQC